MFIAHKNELKQGEWKTLYTFQKTKLLVNVDGTYAIRGNICPHQASLIKTKEHGKNLASVCPYHGFSWDKDGNPKGSGTAKDCENAFKLNTDDRLHDHCGFLFSTPIPVDLPDITGDWELVEYRTDVIQASVVSVMDLFLDIAHIPVVHPGVYDRIDVPNVDDITWKTWDGGSVQMVVGQPGADSVWSKFTTGRNLTHQAFWLAVYPFTMFEWQPGAVFVMVNEIYGEWTTSHIFKYRDKTYTDENWKINEDVWETAWKQDRDQAELLQPSWCYVPNHHLEPEKQAFRTWLKQASIKGINV